MAELKTKKTRASVAAFLAAHPRPGAAQGRPDGGGAPPPRHRGAGGAVGNEHRRFRDSTSYKYASGREGDWPVAAFAPRAGRITLYLTCDLSRHRALLARLGRHTKGKGCLHLRRLSDVDPAVLEELVRSAVAEEGNGD